MLLADTEEICSSFVESSVTYRPIARQGLGKYIPAEPYARNNKMSIARKRISKHA
jgi:hypothetical protein